MIDLLPSNNNKLLPLLQVVQVCRQSTADILDAFPHRRHVDRGHLLAESMRKIPCRELYHKVLSEQYLPSLDDRPVPPRLRFQRPVHSTPRWHCSAPAAFPLPPGQTRSAAETGPT